eukprot:scaffold90121_cov30-Tisochrysis_lutea.AAC.4
MGTVARGDAKPCNCNTTPRSSRTSAARAPAKSGKSPSNSSSLSGALSWSFSARATSRSSSKLKDSRPKRSSFKNMPRTASIDCANASVACHSPPWRLRSSAIQWANRIERAFALWLALTTKWCSMLCRLLVEVVNGCNQVATACARCCKVSQL